MQAVILAAGRGTRMGSLTEKLPKPMLEVARKTLLEHKFDALPEEVDEIIIVIGYLGNTIQEKFGDSYKGKSIRYVTAENFSGGTAYALWKAKDLLQGTFVVLAGDDLFGREDIEAVLAFEWAFLVQRVVDTSIGGKVVIDLEGNVVDILETNSGGEGVVSAGLFVADARLFEHPMVPKSSGSDEYGLPQTMLAASKIAGIPIGVVEATQWQQITNPDDLVRAEKVFGKK